MYMFVVVMMFVKFSSLCVCVCLVWFVLVWFYGISTFVGYLMPNPFYTKIKQILNI